MKAMNDRATWLKSGASQCSHPPVKPRRTFRFIILGAPGVGKGTQAEMLCHQTHVCHLSTGDVFRASSSLPHGLLSPAMKAAQVYMNSGRLVPDDTVLLLVKERLECLHCQGGFLLDGFPRTLTQAVALDGMLGRENITIDAVINYELPELEIVKRISGRCACLECRITFHETANPPVRPGYCDHCGGLLVKRVDDNPEAIRTRLRSYHESTEPLIRYYGGYGRLKSISAYGTPEEVQSRTVIALSDIIS